MGQMWPDKDSMEQLMPNGLTVAETNYSTDLASEIADAFEKSGYETNLVYCGRERTRKGRGPLQAIEIARNKCPRRYAA